jgi:hypothetical protein
MSHDTSCYHFSHDLESWINAQVNFIYVSFTNRIVCYEIWVLGGHRKKIGKLIHVKMKYRNIRHDGTRPLAGYKTYRVTAHWQVPEFKFQGIMRILKKMPTLRKCLDHLDDR